MAKALMIQGCTSSAGKSYITAAICRILSNEGVKVAPFKAQNMSNNAGVTEHGLEMGRAQIVQAIAARVTPDVRMNPVLLKPEADNRSQVIVMGKVDYKLSALPWRERKSHLWETVKQALHSLLAEYEVIVIEGAGSPAEINLRSSDIVNMAVALEAQASVLLVSDIDRGGSFAHLLGTWQCCSLKERELMKGFILNRFRGDASLLVPAPQWLEAQTGVPTVGIVPMLDVPLPEEDGMAFETTAYPSGQIAVIALPRISNLDEFAALGESIRIVRSPRDLKNVKAVILPGSKSTLSDLEWLRTTGLAKAITDLAQSGLPILGICGGMQMLGTRISDPFSIEGGGDVLGLGLLDLETIFDAEKITRAAHFRDLETNTTLLGYEIHTGRTTAREKVILECRGEALGWQAGNVRGVYAHGLFDNTIYLEAFLARTGVPKPRIIDPLDGRLDTVAARVEAALEWQRIRSWLT